MTPLSGCNSAAAPPPPSVKSNAAFRVKKSQKSCSSAREHHTKPSNNQMALKHLKCQDVICNLDLTASAAGAAFECYSKSRDVLTACGFSAAAWGR